MKWLKRLFLVVICLLLAAGIAFFSGERLWHARPEWYPTAAVDPVARAAAAHRAQNKLLAIRNFAAESKAAEMRASLQGADDPAAPKRSITLSLTEEEMNAFFDKWQNLFGFEEAYGQYLSEPMIVLRDKRLILAGSVKDLDSLISIHFDPSVDKKGKLQLNLRRVLGGKLPLPKAFWSGYRHRVTQDLRQRLPDMQREATIDEFGVGNAQAIAATMTKLLLGGLEQEPSEAVIFLPHDVTDFKQGVPVKVTEVDIRDKTLTLTVVPLNAEDRQELLESIRQPFTETARTD